LPAITGRYWHLELFVARSCVGESDRGLVAWRFRMGPADFEIKLGEFVSARLAVGRDSFDLLIEIRAECRRHFVVFGECHFPELDSTTKVPRGQISTIGAEG